MDLERPRRNLPGGTRREEGTSVVGESGPDNMTGGIPDETIYRGRRRSGDITGVSIPTLSHPIHSTVPVC